MPAIASQPSLQLVAARKAMKNLIIQFKQQMTAESQLTQTTKQNNILDYYFYFNFNKILFDWETFQSQL